jgi:hypothetical protein
MSFVPSTTPNLSTNPIENTINSLNSNPYFIGSMMILLNLGGRHLASALTPEQDKFFQQPWFRRILIFVVFFVGTRNALSSLFMAIIINFLIAFLFNEQSEMYLLKPNVTEKKTETKDASGAVVYTGLTVEETEIHKRLSEKLQKSLKQKNDNIEVSKPEDITSQIIETYSGFMSKF